MTSTERKIEDPEAVNLAINRTALFVAPVLIVVTYSINLNWIKDHFSKMGWGEMGLHPVLLTAGFLLLNPLAVLSFRIFRDMLGFSQYTAMCIHALLQTTAMFCSFCGVWTMQLHMNDEDLTSEEFSSIHSMCGIFMVCCWGVHCTMSLYIFFFGSKSLCSAYRQTHMSLGTYISIAVLIVIMLGMVVEEIGLNWTDSYYKRFRVGGLCILLLIITLGLSLWKMPTRPKKA